MIIFRGTRYSPSAIIAGSGSVIADVIWLNHMRDIVSTPDTVGGSPRIDGTRWSCANVVASLWYNSYTIDQFLSEFETVFEPREVLNCVKYCAEKRCTASNVHSFCEHCTLDVEWGKQLIAENEQAIRDGLPPPNETQEDYWQFAAKLLERIQ